MGFVGTGLPDGPKNKPLRLADASAPPLKGEDLKGEELKSSQTVGATCVSPRRKEPRPIAPKPGNTHPPPRGAPGGKISSSINT